MAAGIVYHNITTASGVSFTVASWVPDTTVPDVGAFPVHVLLNSAGSPLAMGSGANGATVLRVAMATDGPGVTTLGQTTKSASLPVTFPSDADIVTTDDARSSTATLTALASDTTSAQLLAATAGRRGLMLTNTDANGVYVKYGTTASATSFTVLIPAGGYWEMPKPIYTGRIDALWAGNGSGSLYATELT